MRNLCQNNVLKGKKANKLACNCTDVEIGGCTLSRSVASRMVDALTTKIMPILKKKNKKSALQLSSQKFHSKVTKLRVIQKKKIC